MATIRQRQELKKRESQHAKINLYNGRSHGQSDHDHPTLDLFDSDTGTALVEMAQHPDHEDKCPVI